MLFRSYLFGPEEAQNNLTHLIIPWQQASQKRQCEIHVPEGDRNGARPLDPIEQKRLVRAIAKAHHWLEEIINGQVSSLNAIVRYAFNTSSNAFLELQWYLFGAVVLLGAAYTFKANEHIRIDILSSRLSKRSRDWIDIVGHILFLMPLCLVIMWLGWPFFLRSFAQAEVSSSAGGLIVWPAKLLVPLGFTILFIQSISELIKRVAVMQGLIEDPHGVASAHAPTE